MADKVFIVYGDDFETSWIQSIHKTQAGATKALLKYEQDEIMNEPDTNWRNTFSIRERKLEE